MFSSTMCVPELQSSATANGSDWSVWSQSCLLAMISNISLGISSITEQYKNCEMKKTSRKEQKIAINY
jgi:hypothetical protein